MCTQVITSTDIGSGLEIVGNKLVSNANKQFSNQSAFPATGEAGIFYVDKSTGKLYYWDGTAYQDVTSDCCPETVTSLSITGTKLTYVDEAGVSNEVELKSAIESLQVNTLLQNTVVGHKIGDYTNEAGVKVDINETITTLDAVFNEADYKLSITYVDENGATTSKVLDLSILAPLLITSVVATNETGFHKDDGTITITASGGKLPLQYSIDGGVTFFSSNVFSNLVAGTYQIVVKNASGDTKTSTVIVTQPDDLVVTATSTNETSFDANNGTITAASTGGVAPIQYSIDGVNYQSSPNFTGVVAGVYTVYGKDSVGDIHTTTVTIIQPADLTLTLISSTNETSFNADNGTITVLASGGVGAYSYSIDGGVTWQSSGTFNNLVAGTYSVIVKDQATPTNDTATVSNIVITQPDDLLISLVSQTNETAFDKNDGSIVVSSTGGIAPVTYSIDGGITWQSSPIFNNLPAGTYSVIAKDSVNDTATVANIVITQPDDLVAVLVSTTNETAFDKNDGTITVTQTGGVAPFTYSIDGVNFQSSPVFTGLPAGSYTVTVKDSTGDTSTVGTAITQPADLSLSVASFTNETAFDKNDGTITVTASGGVGPFQYSIDNGVTWQSSNVFTGLQAGSYTILVKDSTNDTATTSVTLTQPADLGINLVSKTDETVAGANNGSITVAGVNGVPGYTYSIDGVNYQASGTFTNLPAGAYTVTVKDSSGDTASLNTTVNAGAVATVPIILNLTDLGFWRGCNGTNNGWFTDLKFEAAYTDSNGNPATAFLTDGPGVDSPQTIYAKSGTNVALVSTISDTDPNPTYCCKVYQTYVEEGGSDLGTGNLTQTTTPLGAGNATASYSFTASATRTFTAYARQTSDDANCGGGGTALSVTATKTDETASGANDGTITATGAGGTAPYEYSIDGVNFQSSNVFSNLAPNTYTVTVRDSTSATATTSVTIAAGSGGAIPTAPADYCSGGLQVTAGSANTGCTDLTNSGSYSECLYIGSCGGTGLSAGEQHGYDVLFNASAQITITNPSAYKVYLYVNDVYVSVTNYAANQIAVVNGPGSVVAGDKVKLLVVEG